MVARKNKKVKLMFVTGDTGFPDTFSNCTVHWHVPHQVLVDTSPLTRGYVPKFATMLHSMLRQNLNKKQRI